MSWLFFAPIALLSWLTGLSESAPWLPFFISIFLIGLPHGAADWILLRPSSPQKACRAFLLYSLVGAFIALLGWLFPFAVIIGFFILTIVHFGMNDERDLRSFESASTESPRGIFFRFGGIARIAVFLTLICHLHPNGVAQLFGRVGRLFGSQGLEKALASSFAETSFLILILSSGAWLLSLIFTCYQQRQGGHPSPCKSRLKVELGEGGLLIGAAVLLDPVFAVGLYFLTWHAMRHSLMVIDSFAQCDDTRKSKVRSLSRLHLRAWPLYLPVVPLMFVLISTNGTLTSPTDWVASLLVVCIIFTLPHHLIVEKALME